jgi:hypothetical protein
MEKNLPEFLSNFKEIRDQATAGHGGPPYKKRHEN